MNYFCSVRHIRKTRKEHKCELCNRIIPKGSKAIVYSGHIEDSWFRHYLERTCNELSESFPGACCELNEDEGLLYLDTQTLNKSMKKYNCSTPEELLQVLNEENEKLLKECFSAGDSEK